MTTQNCAECGTRAEPGQSFCDACGAVLSWTDRPAARPTAPSGPARTPSGPAAGAAAPSAPGAGSTPAPGATPSGPGPAASAQGAGSATGPGTASGTASGHVPGAGSATGQTSAAAPGPAPGPGPVPAPDSGPWAPRTGTDSRSGSATAPGAGTGTGSGSGSSGSAPGTGGSARSGSATAPGAGIGAGTGTGAASTPGAAAGPSPAYGSGPDPAHASGPGSQPGLAHGSGAGSGSAPGSTTAHGSTAGHGQATGHSAAAGHGGGVAQGPGTAHAAGAASDGGSGPGHRPAQGTVLAASPPTPPAPAASAAAPAADDDHDPDDEDTTETPLPVIPPEDGTAAPSGTAPAAAHPPAPDATAPTAPVPAAAPAPALGDTMAARARSLLVPVADAEPRPAAPPSVAPVLPGRPVADRPQVRAPGPVQGEQFGVACPWCATPNNPDRHFCVRCAMPMTLEDRSSLRLPWWRRLFHRNREAHWAGDRPRLRRTFDRILSWVVAAVVLTLVIIAGVNTPAAIQATRDHFAKRAPVAPDSFAASRSYPGHKPELAFDKINNSWWGPGVSQSGEGEWIEARFDEPTRLLDLIITSGTSVRPDQLTQSALPHRIKATITLKDGKTTTREIVLDQSSGGQRRAFRVGEVTKVRFTIESSYMASPSKQVSIAEIEFFGPSSANAT